MADTECTSYEYEYTFNNETFTTQIYDNDLKCSNYFKLNMANIKNLPPDCNNTVQSRLDKHTDESIDLSYLELDKVPPLITYTTIKYLFITNNNIKFMDDFHYLTNLIIIDLSHNHLTHMPKMPKSIEEIRVKCNNISEINIKYKNLKRLDVSNNHITTIPSHTSLEILMCDHNNLTTLGPYPNITKLSCKHNKITTITGIDNCQVLECDDNEITNITNLNVEQLYCNDNKITHISNLPNIKVLHCHNNLITRIPFFETLLELSCDYNSKLSLSKAYEIKTTDFHDTHVVLSL